MFDNDKIRKIREEGDEILKKKSKEVEVIDEKILRREVYKPQNGIVIEGVEDAPAGIEAISDGVEIIESGAECINNEFMQGAIPTAYCP